MAFVTFTVRSVRLPLCLFWWFFTGRTVHDLNAPLHESMLGAYDLVYDGGTIEHCFDIRTIVSNYASIPAIGGSLIIQTMANNHFGHGFYQFSPEFFYRVFASESGYAVKKMIVHETFEYARWYDVPDPAIVRSRIELSNCWVGVILLAHMVREKDVPFLPRSPMQSDYAATWAEDADARVTQAVVRPATARAGGSGLRSLIKRLAPGLVVAKHRFNHAFPVFTEWFNRRRAARYHKGFSFRRQPAKFRPFEAEKE
ncbi:MAG: hypothetical protein NTU79_06195 [Planctomycetota bacterium]|nr:hypothetical protein [Planctomycetota bacterium]